MTDFLVKAASDDLYQLHPLTEWAEDWISRHGWKYRRNGNKIMASAVQVFGVVERILDAGGDVRMT